MKSSRSIGIKKFNYKCDRVYSYFENNELKFGKKEALTITESDQLEYIEQLINDFPEITFHIAASTIMSDKLTRLDINNNVELYPCITEQKRKELFERCDIYWILIITESYTMQ